MKILFPSRFAILFICFITLSFLSINAQPNNGSNKEIRSWYNSREWLNGLKLKPHKSVNKQEFSKQYHLNKIWWEKAFSYLKETDLAALKPGKHLIDGENVFATVSEGPTKDLVQTKWEAHKKYLDIHYVIEGKEKIGIAPVSSASVLQEYDSAKDIAFYTSKGKYFQSSPGTFFIAFPTDAHRPGVKAKGYDKIKKIVIKIRVSE